MNEIADRTTTTRGSAEEARNRLSTRRRVWVTIGLLLGIFLAAIEQTVVATAMPTLVASLGGLNIYSWVFSIYLLASTVSVPFWGRLADMYGRKRFYVASVGLFLAGSVLSGQSHSMAFLVLARAIQGLGAGGVFPIGLTILSDIYTMEERARIQGVFSSVWGFASMVGPLVGGVITDLLSWRWVFYVNLPFGLAAIYVIHRALTEPSVERPTHSLEVKGALTLSAAVSLLLVALIDIGEGARGPSEILLVAGSAIMTLAFVRFEARAKEPLLPVALFRNPVFRSASALSFCCGMGLFGAISFVPLFVQGVLFRSATEAGSALTPLLLTWVALSTLSGWLTLSLGYRPLVTTGMAFFGVGFALLHRLDADASLPAVWLSMAVLGIGMGFSMVTTILAVQNSVTRKLVATATSTTYFFRTIGGTVGVALMGAVITHHVTSASRAVSDPTLIELAARPDFIIQPESRARLSLEALEWLRHALAGGLRSTFLVGVLIATVAFVVTLTFPRGSARELAERREL